jgi:peptidoglycan/LPS O-acetylase OafA/YrhL
MANKPRQSLAAEHHLVQPKYRADIDGLRAIAVLAVIGFHAFPSLVKGGFVGVDVFFVISGFLISSVIFESLDKGTFSFGEFYARRIKRIFPALIVVMTASLIFGRFVLLADEYKQLGKHIAAGAGFVSNFFFWQEAGYFDSAADAKPMLHLWSLGVEEQFYIVWPLMVYVASARRFNLVWLGMTIVVISFVFNVGIVHGDVTHAFYSPASRFWELSIGSVLAYLTLRGTSVWGEAKRRIYAALGRVTYSELQIRPKVTLGDAQSGLGALLIGAAVLLISNDKEFPGWWALLPTIGTYLIVSAGPQAWLNRTVLSHRVVVWFGLISYPLYLWHWPLLSFARILGLGTPPREMRIAAVVASIVLAWLTYKLVERPIRFGKRGTRTKVIVLCGLMALVGCLGYYAFRSDVRSLSPAEQKANALSRYDYFGGKTEQEFWGDNSCFLIREDYKAFDDHRCLSVTFPDRPVAFLVGDSHSAYLAQALRPFLRARQINFAQFSSGYCTPLNTADKRERCADINRYILQKLAQVRPDILIIFANYQWGMLQGYGESISYETLIANKLSEIENLGVRKIILVGQMPTWQEALPKILARRFLLQSRPIPNRTYTGIERTSLEWDLRMKSQKYSGGVTYVSLRDLLCDEQGCLTYVGNDPESDLIVFDYGHLTPAGAQYVTSNALAPLLISR